MDQKIYTTIIPSVEEMKIRENYEYFNFVLYKLLIA